MIILFPVAGKAERFGGTFKPMLNIKGESFLKITYKSFNGMSNKLVYSIHNKLQENLYSAANWLHKEIPEINSILIKDETSGPLQTVIEGIKLIDHELEKNEDRFVICDCDHWVDLTKFDESLFDKYDVILPLWKIENETPDSWLIASINNHGHIFSLQEKPSYFPSGEFRGVIGCYFFKSYKFFKGLLGSEMVEKSISDILKKIPLEKIGFFEVEHALFYGDKKRLKNAENNYDAVKTYM